MDFSPFEVLSFDCYGTLVDWEEGILSAMTPLLTARGHQWDDDRILEEFAAAEAVLEAGPYQCYADVLQHVAERILHVAGVFPARSDRFALVDSHPEWRPFPDTVAALRALSTHYKLVIISNVDDDLFRATQRPLEVPFHAVITAQQVGSYKPNHANFEHALERVGVPKERWLHVAQSTFHDIRPARELGLSTVWVNRRAGKSRPGASLASDAQPDLEVPDMATLAHLAL